MGSSKDRAAVSMVLSAIHDGCVIPGKTTIIESTSGNTGVALASVCKFFRLPLICVVDRRLTSHPANLLRAFGATVDLVTAPHPATGELLPARPPRVPTCVEIARPPSWP